MNKYKRQNVILKMLATAKAMFFNKQAATTIAQTTGMGAICGLFGFVITRSVVNSANNIDKNASDAMKALHACETLKEENADCFNSCLDLLEVFESYRVNLYHVDLLMTLFYQLEKLSLLEFCDRIDLNYLAAQANHKIETTLAELEEFDAKLQTAKEKLDRSFCEIKAHVKDMVHNVSITNEENVLNV